MRYFLIILLIMFNNFSEADSKDKLPSLGSCDQYTDYYIYQCRPFKCELEINDHQKVYREMEITGMEDGKCIHNINLRVRHNAFPPADFHIFCKLSKEGRTEMAELFAKFKQGDRSVYERMIMSKELRKECEP